MGRALSVVVVALEMTHDTTGVGEEGMQEIDWNHRQEHSRRGVGASLQDHQQVSFERKMMTPWWFVEEQIQQQAADKLQHCQKISSGIVD